MLGPHTDSTGLQTLTYKFKVKNSKNKSCKFPGNSLGHKAQPELTIRNSVAFIFPTEMNNRMFC